MCTVTWTDTGDDGYQLVFSRDEQRSRPQAHPPRVVRHGDISVLAPNDPHGGGTWIFANECGLTACLLNVYDAPPPPPPLSEGLESRGRLLLGLAQAPDASGLGQRLAAHVLAGRHRPCLVLALDPARRAQAWVWDGRALRPHAVATPGILTTSSFDTPRVVAARCAAFAARNVHEPDLQDFHRAAGCSPSACSVRMTRSDALTVSLTHVRYRPGKGLCMHYAPRDDEGGFLPGTDHMLFVPASTPNG